MGIKYKILLQTPIFDKKKFRLCETTMKMMMKKKKKKKKHNHNKIADDECQYKIRSINFQFDFLINRLKAIGAIS